MFSKIPQMMFTQAKDKPLIEPLTKSFCLQMITVSLLGYLVSNQDFSYVESHFQYLAHYVHRAFVSFLRCLLRKFTQEMFETNYWA